MGESSDSLIGAGKGAILSLRSRTAGQRAHRSVPGCGVAARSGVASATRPTTATKAGVAIAHGDGFSISRIGRPVPFTIQHEGPESMTALGVDTTVRGFGGRASNQPPRHVTR